MKRNIIVNEVSCVTVIAVALGISACGRGPMLQPAEAEPIEVIQVDLVGAIDRLGEGVKLQTVSYQDPAKFDPGEFKKLHKHLEKSFPTVHGTLKREIVNDYSLLYTWQGSNSELKPALIMAHLDVVPALQDPDQPWTYPPFSGEVAEQHLWGRGTMDDKSNVFAQLEAAEILTQQGFQPERTIYFAYGHDEEIGGPEGAGSIAALLRERGVTLEYAVDEGMAIVAPGIVTGVDQWTAILGIAEKGYVSFELTSKNAGGHSSQPSRNSAIGDLAKAIVRLEKNQRPARLAGPAKEMLRYSAPAMSPGMRFVLGNTWLFGPIVKWQMLGTPSGNAQLRTTTAVTMIEGGYKENILPTEAKVVINHRILPGETSDDVLKHVRKTIKNDEIEIAPMRWGNDPSPVSPIDSPAMQTVVKSIREVFPEVLIIPGLVGGGTDTKHYSDMTENVIRFAPQRFEPDDLHRFHGIDERIGLKNYAEMIRFYVRLIENTAS